MPLYNVAIVPPPEPTKKEIAELKRDARTLLAQKQPSLPVKKNTPVILEDNAKDPRWEGKNFSRRTPYIVVDRYCQIISVLVRKPFPSGE